MKQLKNNLLVKQPRGMFSFSTESGIFMGKIIREAYDGFLDSQAKVNNQPRPESLRFTYLDF